MHVTNHCFDLKGDKNPVCFGARVEWEEREAGLTVRTFFVIVFHFITIVNGLCCHVYLFHANAVEFKWDDVKVGHVYLTAI